VFPPNTVIFEDAEAGIEAAYRGGFWSIGLAGHDPSGLDRVHLATIILPDLAHTTLSDILAKLNAAAETGNSA
jgi:kojibiose phosphorylase